MAFYAPSTPPSAPSSGTALGWIDVRAYGAAGDGVADDTAAVSAALAALPASGGVLYFPTGTYRTSGGLTIDKPCIIRGDGGALDYLLDATATKVTCTSATAVMFDVTARFARFEHIAIVSASATAPTAGAGIRVTAAGTDVSQKVDYHDITVSGFYIDIDSQIGWGWVLSDSLILDPVLHGIQIQNTVDQNGGNWCIDNTTFLCMNHAADSAMHILGSGGGRITHCKTTWGLSQANSFAYSISVIPSPGVITTDLLISTCSLEDSRTAHIYIDLGANNTIWQNIIIDGNQLDGDLNRGIVINGNRTAVAQGNTNGVTPGNRITIVGNTITHTFLGEGNVIALQDCYNVFADNNASEHGYATLTQTNCTCIYNNAHGLTNPPSVAAGANNGSAPAVPTVSADSTDYKGLVSFGSGAAPSAGAQCVVSWGNTWGIAPKVFLEPLNAQTAALTLYVSAVTAAGGFTISSVGAPAASQIGSTYQVQFMVTE